MSTVELVRRCVVVVAVLAGVCESRAYESRTCLAKKVSSWKPVPLELSGDGVFIPEDGKIWAYTSIEGDRKGDQISHLWVRGETKIDLISSPIVKGRYFYSNKVLTLHHAGRWEMRALNKNGDVLSRLPFLVIRKENQMAIQPLDGESIHCAPSEVPAETVQTADKNTDDVPAAVEAAPEVIDTPIKGDWIVGLAFGIAQPLGPIKEDLNLGQSGQLTLTRLLHILPMESALTIGLNHTQFSKDDAVQDNSARDTNISAYYSLVWRPTDRFRWNVGLGLGASRWRARSFSKMALLEVDNSGVDLSTDLMIGAAYQFKKAFSVSFTAIGRETFGDFNESYVPVMLGITYEFGGQQ